MDSERLTRLLVGEDRRRTRVAVVLAGVLMVVAMIIDYLALSYNVGTEETAFFGRLGPVYALYPIWERGLVSLTWVYGYILVELTTVANWELIGYAAALGYHDGLNQVTVTQDLRARPE